MKKFFKECVRRVKADIVWVCVSIIAFAFVAGVILCIQVGSKNNYKYMSQFNYQVQYYNDNFEYITSYKNVFGSCVEIYPQKTIVCGTYSIRTLTAEDK